MRTLSRLTLIAAFLCAGPGALAYKEPTHAAISKEAVTRSVLSTGLDVTSKLGLTMTRKYPLVDASGKQVGPPGTIAELIVEGSIREDHGIRALTHFFNPLNDTGLAATSPSWALEDGVDIEPLLVGSQEYSHREARRYMYKALTATDPEEREKNWGLLFRTLGHVIHHIQDMAQPQHSRIDLHCDLFFCPETTYPNSTLYEKYTDELRAASKLRFFGYDTVYSRNDTATFNAPRLFWTTPSGMGIADFSNRGFVTSGTNFDGTPAGGIFPKPRFPNPNTNGVDPVTTEIDISHPSLLGSNQPLRGKVTFVRTVVHDARTQADAINERASTYSVFDPDLRWRSLPPKFSMNRFNFEAAHDFLLPRAVGYSSGFLNYFFRGQLECRKDQAVATGCRIRNLSSEPMWGTFQFYYDTAAGKRLPVPGAKWTIDLPPSDPNDPNAGYLATFVPPLFPRPMRRGNYVLVFSGDHGEEKESPGSWIGAVTGTVIESFPYLGAGPSVEHGIATSRTFAYTWGCNLHAEHGTGATFTAPPLGGGPVVTSGLTSNLFVPLFNVVHVAKGGYHNLAVLRGGEIVGWGYNFESQTGYRLPAHFIARPRIVEGLPPILEGAGGGRHSLALARDGSVWSWGLNYFGQLGAGYLGNPGKSPFTGIPRPQRVPLSEIVQVAAGEYHSMALKSDGTVVTWGNNYYGQLGNGSFQPIPQQASPPDGVPSPTQLGLSNVIAIAAGHSHSLALTEDGSVWGWGFNNAGQTGTGGITSGAPYGIPTPARIAALTDIIAIAAGGWHSLALKRDGTVWAWGWNNQGQVGNGLTSLGEPTPAKVAGLSDIVEIAGGGNFSYALQRNGVVWTWGTHRLCELALGDPCTGFRAVPGPSSMFVQMQ